MITLVTGAAGQLGHDVALMLRQRKHKVFSTDLVTFYNENQSGALIDNIPYCAMDFTNLATCERVIGSVRAEAVIHCGSWSDIYSAEKPENHKYVEKANIKGTENIALVCRKMGIKLIFISSAQVYKSSKLVVDEESALEPVNFYGKSKLMAEGLVNDINPQSFIVRTQWLYGMNGDNYVKDILRAGEQAGRASIRAAGDLIGTPTYTKDLARLLVDMLETTAYGTYNAAGGGGYVSRAELACEVFRRAGIRNRVIPISHQSLPNAIHEAEEVRLSMDRLRENHFRQLPSWDAAIGRFLEDIKYPRRIR